MSVHSALMAVQDVSDQNILVSRFRHLDEIEVMHPLKSNFSEYLFEASQCVSLLHSFFIAADVSRRLANSFK